MADDGAHRAQPSHRRYLKVVQQSAAHGRSPIRAVADGIIGMGLLNLSSGVVALVLRRRDGSRAEAARFWIFLR